jgi:hypothetical protein
MKRLLALVAVAALSCDPSTANGTALFIEVDWSNTLGVDQLRFSASTSTSPAFMTASRPETPEVGLLSPQSVRALLSDSFGGKAVDVTVDGLSRGKTVAKGRSSVTAVLGREVSVSVTLTQSNGGAGGGGGGMGGGAGGGMGGGGGSGGGSSMCSCPNGCCASGQSGCEQGNGYYFTCGQGSSCNPINSSCGSSNYCSAVPTLFNCNRVQADRCTNGTCMCGDRAPCPDGLFCVTVNGVGGCYCTGLTCDGCCANETTCVRNPTALACGNTGNLCVQCLSRDGGSTACVQGVCGIGATGGNGCDGGCLSGNSCVDAGFPRCIGASGACAYCDALRSDHCGAAGTCACGNMLGPCTGMTTCSHDGGSGQCLPYSSTH